MRHTSLPRGPRSIVATLPFRCRPAGLAGLAMSACLAAAACAEPDPSEPDAEDRDGVARPAVEVLDSGGVLPDGLPFSGGVRVEDVLYLSGQVGNVPGSLDLVPGGLPAESRQTMENIEATLVANGYSLADVIKCTVMLTDMSRWSEFNDIYVTYFEKPYPARTAIGATGLALGAVVEVECIAARGASVEIRSAEP